MGIMVSLVEKGGIMKCTECKYCVEEEYGYSNWTVEGVEVDCLLGKHPKFPVDRFYGEEEDLLFASKCKKFIRGGSTEIDCDREDDFPEDYSDDEEIRKLLVVWDETRRIKIKRDI